MELYINSKGGLKNEIIKIENNRATVKTTFEDKKMITEYCKINKL